MGDLGKIIVAKGFKKCPKSNKSSNLVTLATGHTLNRDLCYYEIFSRTRASKYKSQEKYEANLKPLFYTWKRHSSSVTRFANFFVNF